MPKISPAEPVTAMRSIKIRENGEPLVDFLEVCPDVKFSEPVFTYRRETYLRQSTAERLGRANERLMGQGYRIQILEGWRAPLIQRRMYAAIWEQFKGKHPHLSDTALKRLVNRFSAPMDKKAPPPHTTGGAMDIMLTDMEDRPIDLMDGLNRWDHGGFPFGSEKVSAEARKHRDLLGNAMNEFGLTNYPMEYWHWSYGDQGWAYRGSEPFALYAAIEPPGWTPAPEDDTEAPLRFIDESAYE